VCACDVTAHRVAGEPRAPHISARFSSLDRRAARVTTLARPSIAIAARRDDRAIGIWLLCCAAMVFAMVVIGGATRLTESGLSIAEWRPLIGILPPFGDDGWQRVFGLYRQTPEYQKINAGMTLAEFRTIFWWEYVHRLWGQLIGFVFLLPFAWFLLHRRIDLRLAPRLALLFALGGIQGALGWYMVRSGLVDVPEVSQYRLTAHLVLALIILAALLWTGMGLALSPPPAIADRRLAAARRLTVATLCLVALTIVAGGFVAGTDAGLAYNTFPLMDGRLVPPGYMAGGWTVAPFEDIATIQFHLRLLAVATLATALATWWQTRWLVLPPRGRLAANALAAMALVQATLGVATLLLVVPVALGVAHQAGAAALLSATLWLLFELRTSAAA
jgi:cytochrome c oxidase assembly protein subunit 15